MEKSEGLQRVGEELKKLSYIPGFSENVLNRLSKIIRDAKNTITFKEDSDRTIHLFSCEATDCLRESLKIKIYHKHHQLMKMSVEEHYFKKGDKPLKMGSRITNQYEITTIGKLLKVEKEEKERAIYRENGYFTEIPTITKHLEIYQNEQLITSLDVSPIPSKENILKRLHLESSIKR